MAYALQQIINGVTLGMIYGLIAVGYTMVYGIIGMINFAHGDIFMIGAFLSLMGLTLLSGLSRWQTRLVHEISELKSKSPSQRLATFLLALAAKEVGSGNSERVRLPLTKSVLASRIGIAPESLSRALNRLKAVGVETHGREVEITDIEALRRLVRDGGGD